MCTEMQTSDTSGYLYFVLNHPTKKESLENHVVSIIDSVFYLARPISIIRYKIFPFGRAQNYPNQDDFLRKLNHIDTL